MEKEDEKTERRRFQIRMAQRRFRDRQKQKQKKAIGQLQDQHKNAKPKTAEPSPSIHARASPEPSNEIPRSVSPFRLYMGITPPSGNSSFGFCRLGTGGNVMLELITALNLDVNQSNITVEDVRNNWTAPRPLHLAAQRGHNGIVCVLLKYGVNCDEQDGERMTPLMHAATGGFEDVASSLLDRGASIGCVDRKGRSALHWAARQQREGVLRVLLKHCSAGDGVIDGCDAHGRTPLAVAVENGFEAGVEMLLQAGAEVG